MSSVKLNDDKLKEDVKKLFLNKSEKFKTVDQFVDENYKHFQLSSKFDTTDLDATYLELYFWKRQSQLILNLYNYYELCSDFQILEKGQDDSISYEQFNSLLLPPFEKPSENSVIETLCHFILNYLIVQRMENENHIRKISNNANINYPIKCYVCEYIIRECEIECSACQEPVENTIEYIGKNELLNKKEQILENDGINNETINNSQERSKLSECKNYTTDNKLSNDNYTVYGDVFNNNRIDKKSSMEEQIDKELAEKIRQMDISNQWKCKQCDTINEENCLTCLNCLVSRLWTCKHCSLHNKLSDDKCEACLSVKEEVKEDVNNPNCRNCKNNKIINDELCGECLIMKWKCCNRLCNEKNFGHDKYCKHCGIERCGNDLMDGSIINRCKNGKIDKIWFCNKCNCFNDLTSSICDHCFVKRNIIGYDNPINNDDILNNYNDYLVIDKLDNKENNKWKCNSCKEMNFQEYLSCTKCKVERVELWTCTNCTAENRISNNKCKACNEFNKDKLCKNCYTNEIMCDNVCGPCLSLEWQCRYICCKKKNYGEKRYCKHCGIDNYWRENMDNTFYQLRNNKREEIRICTNCYNINDKYWSNHCENKDCYKFTTIHNWCKKCATIANLIDGLCDNCRSISWRCQYKLCNYCNNNTNNYCKKCGIERYYNKSKGAIIHQFVYGKQYDKWLCHSCQSINDIYSSYCNNYNCSSWKLYYRCKHCGHSDEIYNLIGSKKCANCQHNL